MGTGISGWVEFRDAENDAVIDEIRWFAVIDTSGILRRNYSLFGSLFGVRNRTSFTPSAAARGLPVDTSPAVREDSQWEGSYGHTWINLAELEAIDWDETGFDGLLHVGPIGAAERQVTQALKPDSPLLGVEAEWIENGVRRSVPRITRRAALEAEGQLVLKMMQLLGERYGSECVRVVVWFDN